MGGKFNIEMLGVPELSKALAQLPDNLERKVMVQATKKAAQFYKTLAEARAPRDEGKLASNFKVKAMKRSRRRVGYLIQTGTRAELGIDPKDQGYYPAHVEFGHLDRAGQQQAPNPYMRNALRQGSEAIYAILRQEI